MRKRFFVMQSGHTGDELPDESTEQPDDEALRLNSTGGLFKVKQPDNDGPLAPGNGLFGGARQ